MDKIKVGVVGFGRLGSIHARIYGQLDNVCLVGICDTNPERLSEAKRIHQTAVFSDYKALIKKADAISIAVPTNQHYNIAKDFIAQGAHVLIEKPITNNLSQAKELTLFAEKKKIVLQVGHVERFNSAFKAIKNIASNPLFVECHRLSPFPHRSLDIGVVLDVMIHDIDIILGLVKSEIKKVDAIGVPVLTAFEDIANVRLTFKNGCVCNLTASRISDESMRKIRIFLKDTYISLDYLNQEAFLYKKTGQKIIKTLLPIEKEEPLKKEIESFVDCITNHKKPLVSGKEAYMALRLSTLILNKIWRKKQYFTNQELLHSETPPQQLKEFNSYSANNKKKIFISAGEASGDMHAAQLVKSLNAKKDGLEFMGLGGRLMHEQGVRLFFDPTNIAVVGFTEVLKNIFLFRRIFRDFIERAEQEKPDLIILVDYPGFNLRLAKELKKRGFKIIYYISPQIWAWGKNRINTIRQNIDRIIVLFDFEEAIYKNQGIDVKFVGHPLVEGVSPTLSRERFMQTFAINNQATIISLLPGSRNSVVEKTLPILLESSKHIYKEFPKAQFFIAISPTVDISTYHRFIQESKLPIHLLQDQHYNALGSSDLALVASGTATLETAILNIPMIILYKVSFVTWAFAKCLIKIPYIGLVNVVARKQIVPEFIQFQAKPESIAKEAINILKDKDRQNEIKENLAKTKSQLGPPGASLRAAESIIQLL